MNPNVKIEAREDRVGPETEHIFTDQFFEKLDGVANALDNIDASKEFLMSAFGQLYSRYLHLNTALFGILFWQAQTLAFSVQCLNGVEESLPVYGCFFSIRLQPEIKLNT